MPGPRRLRQRLLGDERGVGGGPKGAATTAEVEVGERLRTADVAEAQAEMELVADEERAYQSENPVGRRGGRGR